MLTCKARRPAERRVCQIGEAHSPQVETRVHTRLKTDFDNIHLVPSNSDLAYVELNTKSGWLIKQSLEQVKGNYDYILIDTPPNFGRLMISGIVASNHIIVAMDPGIFALEGMQDLQVVLENIKKETNIPVNISALLLTKVEKSFFGKNPSKEIEQSLRNEWGEKAFSVPKDNSVYESQLLGMPLSHYRPYSKAGNMYRTIAEE